MPRPRKYITKQQQLSSLKERQKRYYDKYKDEINKERREKYEEEKITTNEKNERILIIIRKNIK